MKMNEIETRKRYFKHLHASSFDDDIILIAEKTTPSMYSCDFESQVQNCTADTVRKIYFEKYGYYLELSQTSIIEQNFSKKSTSIN